MAQGIRDVAMGIYPLIFAGQTLLPALRKLETTIHFIGYGLCHPGTKKKVPMNVQEMIDRWKEIVIVLSTAHDKAAIDQAEYNIDTVMLPLLSAPVKELRQFCSGLVASLKTDTRVPLFVWRLFDAWEDYLVKDATDQEIRELKTGLAREIAELVEQDVQPDIMDAIAGALQWRDPETLEKVRDAVKGGEKPRLRGRESCLFLEVAGETVML